MLLHVEHATTAAAVAASRKRHPRLVQVPPLCASLRLTLPVHKTHTGKWAPQSRRRRDEGIENAATSTVRRRHAVSVARESPTGAEGAVQHDRWIAPEHHVINDVPLTPGCPRGLQYSDEARAGRRGEAVTSTLP